MTSSGAIDDGLIPFDEAPLRRFHVRAVISGTGGQFSDGFILGAIGIALSLAADPLELSSWWLGLLGAGSLAGLFIGSLFGGPIVDRIGRRPIFAYNMLFFSIISLLQFLVTDAWQLLALRVLLGVALGADYVVSMSLITEFAPRRLRGRLLSFLAAAWAAGYVAAYGVGYLLHESGPDAWRWILLSSVVPSTLIFLIRIGIPESPLWLVSKGRTAQARAIVARHLGRDIDIPQHVATPAAQRAGASNYRRLLEPRWRRNTLVGMAFYTCQVIPFFAVSTFTPKIMDSLKVENAYVGGLVYNLFILIGTVLGLLIVDRISRRSFLVTTFYVIAASLFILTTMTSLSSAGVVAVFAVFALALSAACNLEYVYPPELFPTELRASGVGMAVACSRVGSAGSTFLLPVMVDTYGIHTALGACAAVALVGGLICHRWAPETSHLSISDRSPAEPETALAR